MTHRWAALLAFTIDDAEASRIGTAQASGDRSVQGLALLRSSPDRIMDVICLNCERKFLEARGMECVR